MSELPNIAADESHENSQEVRNELEVAKAAARRAKLFFREMPEAYQQYERLRTQLLGLCRDLTKKTEGVMGRGIHEYAQKFEQHMRIHANDFLLKFFNLLDIQNNSAVQEFFRKPNQLPPVLVFSENGYRIENQRTNGNPRLGTTFSNGEYEYMGIFDSPYARESYENFKQIVVHEIIHTLVDFVTYRRQGALREGLTEFIGQQLTSKEKSRGYKLEVSIAAAAWELDQEALKTWFVTADDEPLQTRLRQALECSHPPKKARVLASYVVHLTELETKLFEDAKRHVKLPEDHPDFEERTKVLIEFWFKQITNELRKR